MFGSNLNLEQMAGRCPTAKVVGTAELEGYDLLFRGSRHGAVATVEPSLFDDGKVPVLLWDIQPRDEAALDVYEGWPNFYRKEIQEVEFGGEKIPAMMYVMNDGHELGEPSDYYYDTIREGYESAGFDLEHLDQAVEKSARLARVRDLREAEMLPEQQELEGMEFDDDGLMDMKWW